MTARAVQSGHALGLLDGFPRDLLSRLPPGLFLDVGAATGDKARTMRAASPQSRVIAYEPFPGNLPLLEETARADPMIAVRPVAVAARAGTATLHLPSIIHPKNPRFAALHGTSRTGHLGRSPIKKSVAQVEVPTVTLSDEITAPVRFLKIDVQGGEYNVLRGARSLIERHGIDMIYVEFRGDPRVLALLHRLGYTLHDGLYMAWPHRRYPPNWLRPRTAWTIPNWPVTDTLTLQAGVRARHVWPRVPARGFLAYSAWFYAQRLFTTGLQTDLLCVHEKFRERFEGLVGHRT